MRRYLVLLMVSVPFIAAGGCGDDAEQGSSSSPTVAQVGDTVISQAAVLEEIPIVAPVDSTDKSGIAKPPRFTDCIAASRSVDVNKGATTAALRQACKRQYEQNRVFAAGYLIKTTWSRLEAERKGVEVTQAEATHLVAQRLQALAREGKKNVLTTGRDRRAFTAWFRRSTRDDRLAKALKVSAGAELDKVLLKRYRKQTRCAVAYKKAGIPECNGSTQGY